MSDRIKTILSIAGIIILILGGIKIAGILQGNF